MAATLSTEEAKRFMKNKRHLLSTPNVVCLAFSNEKVNGEKTGRKIFRVGVIKKLPKESIKHPDIFIPKSFEHTLAGSDEKLTIPVKIVEEGELVVAVPDVKGVGDGRLTAAPYKGGSVITNADLQAYGCLGANADYLGAYRLLSAAHVLTKFDRNYLGKQILVRDGSAFVQIGATVTNQVDVVAYDSPTVVDPQRVRQDLAWADITPDRGSPEIIDIGTPKSIRAIVAGEQVKLFAGYSDFLVDNIDVSDISAEMKIRFTNPTGAIKYAFFEDVCLVEDYIPVASGDSGSAIVAEADDALLGILFSHSSVSGSSHFCKLQL